MTFKQSVKMCLGPEYFFRFKGRASRSEFWWFMAFIMAVQGLMILAGLILPATVAALIQLVVPFLILPANMGVTVRRFHDRNLSGWWLLVPGSMFFLWVSGGSGSQFTAVLSLAACVGYLAVLCTPGQPFPNKYGPPPPEALKN